MVNTIFVVTLLVGHLVIEYVMPTVVELLDFQQFVDHYHLAPELFFDPEDPDFWGKVKQYPDFWGKYMEILKSGEVKSGAEAWGKYVEEKLASGEVKLEEITKEIAEKVVDPYIDTDAELPVEIRDIKSFMPFWYYMLGWLALYELLYLDFSDPHCWTNLPNENVITPEIQEYQLNKLWWYYYDGLLLLAVNRIFDKTMSTYGHPTWVEFFAYFIWAIIWHHIVGPFAYEFIDHSPTFSEYRRIRPWYEIEYKVPRRVFIAKSHEECFLRINIFI